MIGSTSRARHGTAVDQYHPTPVSTFSKVRGRHRATYRTIRDTSRWAVGLLNRGADSAELRNSES